MRIYNTLARNKQEFKPIEGNTVRMYSCGPTVYNYAHIGNLRTYIFMDLLRRELKREGYQLRHAMNITDVGHLVSDEDEGEDKMIKGARESNKTPYEIAEFYTKVFMEDIAALNIEKPEIICKATDHINDMIDFVVGLDKKGYAYEISDGIYFDISRFPGYGKLSGANLNEQKAGARVEVNPEKRGPADFALWKKAPKEHIMQWPSPWGMGYPGWHIECSTMSRKYLGDYFDIHTGGVDHIPVHHENEIAQSEALLGKPAVKYWMHGEFMMVDGGKMSKSLGNTYTVSDLKEKGYHPLSFRYFCLNAHYRNKINFTWQAMEASQKAYARLLEGTLAHKNGSASVDAETLAGLKASFDEAAADDLNVPRALGICWNAIRLPEKSPAVYELLLYFDKLLGLDMDRAEEVLAFINRKDEAAEDIPAEVQALLEARKAARAEKNWAESDRLRNEINALGYAVKDSKNGQEVEKIG